MMTHDETVEILATYALDAVDGDERTAIEQHLAECPRCRAELDSWREVATALGNSVEPLPEGLWNSIASRLPDRSDEARPPMPQLVRSDSEGAVENEAVEGDELATRRARRGTQSRGRLAGVIAAVVGVAAVVAFLGVSLVHANDQVSNLQQAVNHSNPPSSVVTALETPGHKVVNLEGPNHAQLAQFVVADGRGYLVSSKLPALSSNQTYQLWGVVDGQPISLGLLGQNPHRSTFTLAGSKSASVLGLTVEPAGGTVVPSQAMVAKGVV
jgi:anti-sigma factor RsiW